MNNLTELVFILDRSGSMRGLEADTIGGFNSLIEKQKQEAGAAFVSTILFDDKIEVLHNRVPLECVAPMTGRDYYVRGCTALLDAIGGAITHISNIHRHTWGRRRPSKTLFVITTDGMENASRQYTYDKVRRMVEKEKNKYGWEFLFLGANIDAIATANRFGIGADYATNYCCDSAGTTLNFDVLNDAIHQARTQSMPLTSSWKARIEEDFTTRCIL